MSLNSRWHLMPLRRQRQAERCCGTWHKLNLRGSTMSLTHNSPKYLEWNLASEKLKGFFPVKIRNFKLLKMPKLLNLRFPEGWYFLNCDNTERKRSSKTFLSVSERHRWAKLTHWSLVGHNHNVMEGWKRVEHSVTNHTFKVIVRAAMLVSI